jgi:uncharacterized membrane protein YphA (DoxX/SURF4 family)
MSRFERFQNIGIHVYGAAGIGFGMIGLVSGDFAGVWQPVPATFPHRTLLAYLAAAIFLQAGLLIQYRRSVRIGLVVMGVLFIVFSVPWWIRVVHFPRLIGTWLGVAEQLALVAGAGIAFLAVKPAKESNALFRISVCLRILFGLCAIVFGLAHFLALPQTMSLVPAGLPLGQPFWALATGIGHMCAGLSIATGVLATLSSRLFTGMLIIFGALVWAPALFANPQTHMVWAGNTVNLAEIGAAWIIADWVHRPGIRKQPARIDGLNDRSSQTVPI